MGSKKAPAARVPQGRRMGKALSREEEREQGSSPTAPVQAVLSKEWERGSSRRKEKLEERP